MKIPQGYHYTKEHEWLKIDAENTLATVGITDFAQNQLGDIVFVDLPEAGATLKKGETFGVVESVKTVSDLFAPVDGKVIEVNQELKSHPEKINQEPYTQGWMLKIEISTKDQLKELLDHKGYEDIAQGE